MVSDALIVHSHKATLEASAFYGIFLVPEDMHHYSNSVVSLVIEIHLDLQSCPLNMNTVQLDIPHSLLISLSLYTHLYKTWLVFTKKHSLFSYSSSTESG